jgi:hypothetical protein
MQPDKLLTVASEASIMQASEAGIYKLFNSPGYPAKKIPGVGWRVIYGDHINYLKNKSKYE